MTDSEFHDLVNQQYLAIEDAIDALDSDDVDIDCQVNSGILSMTFENGSKIIINKQEPLHQIWVATRENGYHFDYKNDQWIDNREGHELLTLLSDACSKQAGAPVSLSA